MKQGLLVIISSPASGGKDTVIEGLLKIFPSSIKFVTTTSRPATRRTDKEGVTYHFISREDFEEKINAGYFLEYNDCADNLYGTPKEHLKKLLSGYDLVFANIDVNGKKSLDEKGIANLSIFLLPESLEVLEKRAEKRGGMTAEMIADRIELAKKEIAAAKDYDYRLVNKEGELKKTIEETANIIRLYIDKKDKKE